MSVKPQATLTAGIFRDSTRYAVMAVATFCLTAVMSNALAFNFTVICMNNDGENGLFGGRKGALLGHRRRDLDRDSAHHNNDSHVRDKERVYGFLFGLRNSDDAHALGHDLGLRIGFYDA
ncbi:hypothetical protein L596_004276 [Steinernema carpocapsae]|uniref:Uncharacterized protein n=1 Tax=Steinernema carpocapsae TaxID=34508 RepID=A0A4U8UVA8_STECR|nr:hypothetical protein L596_004276 [Steinernema carpocapsae]